MLILGGAAVVYGASDQRPALLTKSEAAFDRVQLAAVPDLRDTTACVQAQAAFLPAALPDDLPVVHFRKAYCTLAGAAITGNAAEFTDAASEFDRTMQSWPRTATRNKPPEPISSGLLVLASIARLKAGTDADGADLARNQIAAALANPVCSSAVVPAEFCQAVLRTGREWRGWMALENGDLAGAAKEFAGSSSGWLEWIAGRRAFQEARYTEAVTDYRRAMEILHPAVPSSLAARLGPPADRASELVALGSAQLLAGDPKAAIATLDQAVKADASDARALYLRARAKEIAGDDSALADYNLASRTAFAGAKDLASGEAHLYRGILLYRRKNYAFAEDEFSSALNFEITGQMRADAVAWRHLAAVTGGSCGVSRQYLERSLAAVSPYFPKDEARAALASCAASMSEAKPAAGSAK